MADQRITQLTALPKEAVAANDVLPITDISASQTKKVTAKDLVDAGLDLVDTSSIDLDKLDQSSTTKLGSSALAAGAVTSAKLAADSTVAVQTTPPNADNYEGRGYFNSNTGNLQVYSESSYQQVILPEAGIGALAVTTGKLADGAVTTAKVTALGTAAYGDASISNAKLIDATIQGGKIASATITSANLSPGAVNTAALGSAVVTYSKIQNVSATDRLLGRSTAGSGSVEEIICTSAGRALLDDTDAAAQRNTLGLGTLSTANGTWVNGSSFSGTSSGTNTGDQTITLTGDVTGSGTGSFAATIAAAAVTEAKLATNAVTTAKVLDDAITAGKLANNSAAIVSAATPSGTGAFTGQQWFDSNTEIEYTWDGVAWVRQAGIGTITFTDSTPLAFSVAYPDPYTATVTTTLDAQAANVVLVGPASGANAAPTFRALVPADLPNATASTRGIIQPGTGLSVTSGVLNHEASVSAATVSGITFNASGHITAATPLTASDIPALDTSKITTGTFGTALLGNDAVTAAKLADRSTAQIGEALPTADYIGQIFFNPLDKTFFLWDGNVWQPIGISFGQIEFAGTYNASTNLVASVTSSGDAVLDAGQPLPAASTSNNNYYLVVGTAGTGTGNAPLVALDPPDYIISDGTAWRKIDVSNTIASLTATNVTFTATTTFNGVTIDLGSGTVQAAICEAAADAKSASNISTGTLAVAYGGTGLASYTKGDLVAASASTTLTKLTVGTNGQVLTADSAETTGLRWATPTTGTVTSVSSSTAALTVATGTTTPALTIRAASTTLDGIVQLSDSTSTTSSTLAATATAVKSAYDLAAAALPKAGGTVTGELLIGNAGTLVFEGATNDAFETTLAVADPTADRTITLPNLSGTVALTSQLDDGTY